MNKLVLERLQIGGDFFEFKLGVNYVVGGYGSGKTTIFQSIRFALGLIKKWEGIFIVGSRIELIAHLGQDRVVFTRSEFSSKLMVCVGGVEKEYDALSDALNVFYLDAFGFEFLYPDCRESAFEVIDFFFVSDDVSSSKQKQWSALRSVLGVNLLFLNSLASDIKELEREVLKDSMQKDLILEFSQGLISSVAELRNADEVLLKVSKAQSIFFERFAQHESLYLGVQEKYKRLVVESNRYQDERLSELSAEVSRVSSLFDMNTVFSGDIQNLLANKGSPRSFGEDVLLRFSLVLAVSFKELSSRLNSIGMLVNDCFLSRASTNRTKKVADILVNSQMNDGGLGQYIEFVRSDQFVGEGNIIRLGDRLRLHGVL
ncbi:ATP-binding protein [Pseudomonas paracarnis]|jgi:hypothetical protein|uniref:ATP-binding protein n=1 Tax=Pseudomonas paracarnis TaxID=2750625 RepID=UPI00143D6EAB|nr:hypothetical protein [Pseudomonas fluorescens]NKI53542.1 hypothetical protein [Pseudomonas fluorescens]NKI62264.1 hypothetical protein [Pseudomonas fluorescens]